MRQNMIRLPDYAWHTMLQHNPSDDAAAVERSNGGGDTAASWWLPLVCDTPDESFLPQSPPFFPLILPTIIFYVYRSRPGKKICALRRPGIQQLKNSLTWPDLILLQSLSLSLFLSFSRFLSPATSSVLSSFSSPSIHLFTSQIRCARIVSTK